MCTGQVIKKKNKTFMIKKALLYCIRRVIYIGRPFNFCSGVLLPYSLLAVCLMGVLELLNA